MDNTSLFFQIFNLNGQSQVLDKLMVFGADRLIYILILFVIILGINGGTKERKAFLLIILGIPVAFLLITGIHLFFFENRPFIAYHFTPFVKEIADASFPSRHTTISSVIAFSYLYFKSKWSLLLLFTAIWIGLARIYVGVHYPVDIAGGFLTAGAALALSLQIKNLLCSGFLKN